MSKIKEYSKKYFVTAMSAMAQGLFATLLIGTIIKTVGQYTGLDFLMEISTFAQGATGMAIGVAIAIVDTGFSMIINSIAGLIG